MSERSQISTIDIVRQLDEFIERAVADAGGSTIPIRPSHRVPFHWPHHPVSADYHVLATDWTRRISIQIHGESHEVLIAKTAQGVFGRVEGLWNEARGETEEAMLRSLVQGCEPYFRRMETIAKVLELPHRFTKTIRELDSLSLVKLLYCPDRDISSCARIEIEKQASSGIFTDALIHILRDDRHPHRRGAQWCALDMFEDLPSFCRSATQQTQAVLAIKDLLWTASDDYARTIYKAGVVLGGHISSEEAGDVLEACLFAPSKTGRRSAIHAVFHLVEWLPHRRQRVVEQLNQVADHDPEQILRSFAARMSRDIASSTAEHATEPLFPEEQ